MPPRPGETIDFDGQRLMLTQVETELMGQNTDVQRTYTFRNIGPIQIETEAEEDQQPVLTDQQPVLTINREQNATITFDAANINTNAFTATEGTFGNWTVGEWPVVDADGDNVLHAQHAQTVTATTTTAPWHLNYNFDFGAAIKHDLSDEFKETLKPFIQKVLKELLEQEGFIIGKLPDEGDDLYE